MRKSLFLLILLAFNLSPFTFNLLAQSPIAIGSGSYASFPPLEESRSSLHGGCQAYQMEHREIYAVDSLLNRPLPSNDWWTYALVNPWTGKLWAYPALVWADATGISIAKPSYWEPTGCEMKWNDPLTITTLAFSPDSLIASSPHRPFSPQSALISHWSDYMIAFVLQDGSAEVRVTLMQGSPLVWLEFTNAEPTITNPDPNALTVFQHTAGNTTTLAVAVLTDNITAEDLQPYAFRIPRNTQITYDYLSNQSLLRTQFHISYQDIVPTTANGIWQGFLPHHYYNTHTDIAFAAATYATPRGEMRLAQGNDFTIDYPVHGMLPFFPVPYDSLSGYDPNLMRSLCAEYAVAGSFGADTYWGGKGLTQMAHYMTTAYQMGDTATFELAKSRLKATLIDWYTYTVGEDQYYFARYDRWGALVGFDPSYDSDTFNDHHFHYGYFVYASALLCMLDNDFRQQYGPMARLVALDYANPYRPTSAQQSSIFKRSDLPSSAQRSSIFKRSDLPTSAQRSTIFPLFRTFNPYLGHSFAGGMGNEGNGNGQESSSESMQGWGGVWMLGAALGDDTLMEAGIYGYTVEARGTAEYWFDRARRNIDYTKYQHPYCCNLTMQGVGWWTWFSGDPVWMHSIQWLPISPILQNYLTEDRAFARWDYTQMYATKEVGNYEAPTGGLGDESGLGNVCLSYLALFDPDSAAHVWTRMRQMGKALAKNPDTGGITYLLAHSLRAYGHQDHSIQADYPLAAAYTDSLTGKTTYAVYNATNEELTVTFSSSTGVADLPTSAQRSSIFKRSNLPSLAQRSISFTAPAHRLTLFTDSPALTEIRLEGPAVVLPNSTNEYLLRFLDQYGATFRADSIIHYTAPATAQLTEIRATYHSLETALPIRVGALPYMATATIQPAIDYLALGNTVDFTIAATDQYGDAYPVDWTYHFAPATPGQYIIAYEGEHIVRDTVVVLPPYPNIALGKPVTASSHENAGTLPEGINDGDLSTRWGSAHKDNEYITIDLQQPCFIDHITLRWEAAYANSFALLITDTIPLSFTPYTLHLTPFTSSGGVQTIELSQTGRYITLVGLTRATQYGTSLYELEAYGMPLAGDNNALFGLAIYADRDALTQNEEVLFEVKGYNRLGEEMTCKPTLIAEGANIQGNRLQPTTTGTISLTANVGNITATRTFIVMESEQITATSVSPKYVTLPLGDTQRFTVSAINQFGITEIETAEYYEATALGDHQFIVSLGGFTDTAYIHVVDFADLNLALGKPTTCSGSENGGTSSDKATDGLLDTRWSSRFQDGEWIVIDLQHTYAVNRVKLYWEAAYATHFDIQLSTDGVQYTTAYTAINAKGGTQDILLPAGATEARYVRILCHERNTGYGSSLYEVEVYGIRQSDMTNVEAPNSNTEVVKRIENNRLVILYHGVKYDTTGQVIGAW